MHSHRFKVGYCEIDGSGTCTNAQTGRRRLQDGHDENRRLDGTVEDPPTWTTPNDSELYTGHHFCLLALSTHSRQCHSLVSSHGHLDILTDALTGALSAQASLQLIYDETGYSQGRKGADDELFKTKNNFVVPLEEETGDYDSTKEYTSTFVKDADGKITSNVKKVDKDGNEVAGAEGKATADPLNDEDKNPCIEHAYLHKTMMQGGGIEVEIIQEPDPRYVECYDRQKARQKREELRKLCHFIFLYGLY